MPQGADEIVAYIAIHNLYPTKIEGNTLLNSVSIASFQFLVS